MDYPRLWSSNNNAHIKTTQLSTVEDRITISLSSIFEDKDENYSDRLTNPRSSLSQGETCTIAFCDICYRPTAPTAKKLSMLKGPVAKRILKQSLMSCPGRNSYLNIRRIR